MRNSKESQGKEAANLGRVQMPKAILAREALQNLIIAASSKTDKNSFIIFEVHMNIIFQLINYNQKMKLLGSSFLLSIRPKLHKL